MPADDRKREREMVDAIDWSEVDLTPVDRNPVDIDQNRPHSARVYDYLLGGRTNFEADRQAAHYQTEAIGGLEAARLAVQANRAFQHRAVRMLVRGSHKVERIRQVLDIGTGIPGDVMTHHVAHEWDPDVAVVYVDHDTTVLAHSHQLLEGTTATYYVDGDLYQMDGVFAEAAEYIDLSKPMIVILAAILHHVPDENDPYGIVSHIVDTMPSGSALVLSHLPSDIAAEEMATLERSVPPSAQYTFRMRSHAEVSRFFDGLTLIEPGVVPADQWRPDDSAWEPYGDTVPGAMWAGAGIKG